MALYAALLVLLILALLYLREFRTLVLLPALGRWAQVRGQHEVARRIYETAVTRPSVLGELGRYGTRFRLAWLYMEAGQYERALEQLETMLRAPLRQGSQSTVRQRMADCLEALGLNERATEERARAVELAQSAKLDHTRLIAEAQMLARDRRYAEAAATYERAIPLIPDVNRSGRAHTMLRLALARFEAGEAEDSARWAERALTLNPPPAQMMTGHNVAGLAYGNLGKYEEAVRHHRAALDLANRAGNSEQGGNYLATLASVLAKQGKFTEAMQACEQASAMSLRARRIARLVQSEIYRTQGLYTEARAMLDQASRAQPFAVPQAQKRSDTIFSSALAFIAAEEGKAQEARALLARLPPTVEQEPKLGLLAIALFAWVCGLEGDAEGARAWMERTEERLNQMRASRSTQADGLAGLGRAAYAIGNWERSEAYWKRHLSFEPCPADQPRAWWYLGQLALKRGNTADAADCFRRACAPGIDTRHARLAREELERLR